MSMSTNVYGIKPPDERWKMMKKVWDTCRIFRGRSEFDTKRRKDHPVHELVLGEHYAMFVY